MIIIILHAVCKLFRFFHGGKAFVRGPEAYGKRLNPAVRLCYTVRIGILQQNTGAVRAPVRERRVVSVTGIIDVGGGMRGIYGAGVLDYCLDNGIRFDYCIGVSAGSANIASYLAGQRGRNYRFYMEYSFRRRYMSLRNWVGCGSYLDLDYVYGELSKRGGEDPLDYAKLAASDSVMKVVALNARTGEPIYFDKADLRQDDYRILMASSSLPVACRPYFVRGVPCYDGGVADPVPLDKAFADGCDRVVLVLTKPVDFLRKQRKDAPAARVLRRRYPRAAEQLMLRFRKYNDGVARAGELARQGRVLMIAPDDCCGMKTLTKDRERMDRLYRKGYSDAREIPRFCAQSTGPARTA